MKPSPFLWLMFTILFSAAAFAQFSSSVQGVVLDPSGAGIPKATVTLVNDATKASQTATTDAAGNFRFVSLAPGAYKGNGGSVWLRQVRGQRHAADRAELELAHHVEGWRCD